MNTSDFIGLRTQHSDPQIRAAFIYFSVPQQTVNFIVKSVTGLSRRNRSQLRKTKRIQKNFQSGINQHVRLTDREKKLNLFDIFTYIMMYNILIRTYTEANCSLSSSDNISIKFITEGISNTHCLSKHGLPNPELAILPSCLCLCSLLSSF